MITLSSHEHDMKQQSEQKCIFHLQKNLKKGRNSGPRKEPCGTPVNQDATNIISAAKLVVLFYKHVTHINPQRNTVHAKT